MNDPAPVRRLTRSKRHKMIAGVCGGLADYFDLDSTLVRVAYVLLSIVSAVFPGMLVYIMADSVAATLDAVVANGGTIVQPIGADAPEITARFSDPAGNVIGLYQEPG